jgi:hypothetical protein
VKWTCVLEAIRTILQKTSLDPLLKEKLTTGALQSEKDIASGQFYTKEKALKKGGTSKIVVKKSV